MDWKLEVATIPVSDVNRGLDFYREKLGFTMDIDMTVGEGVRLVQLTPPGSACSIHLSPPGMGMETGSISGLFLVVTDLRRARDELSGRGVDVGELQVFDEGNYRSAGEDESLDYVGCFFFEDPDGNGWMVQQIPPRG